ncbi:CheR family methyltransferase [Thermodesulfobacteriota bacterium]
MELSASEFDLLRRYIQDLCGITLPPDKSYLIQQRLESVVVAAGCKGFGEFYQMLNKNPLLNIREQIVDAITTNETSFFRDNHPFITFAKHLLPMLGERILQRKARDLSRKGPKVSIWSAGASTGQEPYSLAILIHEFAQTHRGLGISKDDFRLVATDISSETLKRAMAGEYNELEIRRGLSSDRITKYFKQIGTRWLVKSEIRSMVEFRQVNLIKPFTMLGGFDGILCRNVLIYFDIDAKNRMLDQFYEILADGGFLLLGSSENLYGISELFDSAKYNETLVYTKPSKK